MIRFKDSTSKERFQYIHPLAAAIAAQMNQWALSRELPFVITSTVSTFQEDRALGRQSSTHRTARAFDISIHGWRESDIDEFTKFFEEIHGRFGAVSASDNVRRLTLRHEAGHGDHIHVQIAALYSIKDPLASLEG